MPVKTMCGVLLFTSKTRVCYASKYIGPLKMNMKEVSSVCNVQYNLDNWKLKGCGNLLPLIHGSSYPDLLSGHGDSGKKCSYGKLSHRCMF